MLTRAIAVNVTTNTSQHIIEVTEDRLRLVLIRHIDDHKKSRDWFTPLGIFAGVALSLVTADFKKALGVPAEVWNAIFIIASVASFIWLVVSLFRCSKKPTLDHLIAEVKKVVP